MFRVRQFEREVVVDEVEEEDQEEVQEVQEEVHEEVQGTPSRRFRRGPT